VTCGELESRSWGRCANAAGGFEISEADEKHQICLCTEPEFIELAEAAVAVFPCAPRPSGANWEIACADQFERRFMLCDPEVATFNSSWELIVGSSSKE
jgi:hypothetical protein